MSPIEIAIFIIVVNERLVNALFVPVFDKFKWDKFWLMYVAWAFGGVLVWLTGVNLFASYIPNQLIGQILSALLAGGGSNLLHDIFDKKDDVIVLEEVDEMDI